jgi:hypothetical protein
LSENAFPACKLCQAECENCIHENVSGCKLCQVENERFGRNSLSKNKNLSTRTDLKTNKKKIQTAQPSRTPKIYQAGKRSIFKNLSNGSNLSGRETLSDPPVLSTRKNCQDPKMFQVVTNIGSNVGSYTQGRTAGDFLSSRKAA